MAGKKGRSGRPSNDEIKSFSDEVIERVKVAARAVAKDKGYTLEEAMVRMAYDESVQAAVRASIFKTYMDCFVVKKSAKEVGVTDKTPIKPAICLPPLYNDEDEEK